MEGFPQKYLEESMKEFYEELLKESMGGLIKRAGEMSELITGKWS